MIRLTPVTDLRPIAALGFDPAVIEKLGHLVTALPGNSTVNLNAADEEMLAMLFRDPLVAARLIAVRKRKGFLTQTDLTDQHVTLPWGTSFRSNSFWVRTRATIGGTVQQSATLIRRRVTQEGKVEAVPVERWRNAAVPPDAPAFAPVKAQP
jgi:general secretion pathway protein K